MIFVTVGEQLPFDRLITTIDDLAPNLEHEIFAQIGDSEFKPLHIRYTSFLSPGEFNEKFLAADLIVAHAGMGTIITALEFGKPILVMPRQAALGEHRNDHQFATSKRFMELEYILVAFDERELEHKLDALANSEICSVSVGGTEPDPSLLKKIREFILTS